MKTNLKAIFALGLALAAGGCKTSSEPEHAVQVEHKSPVTRTPGRIAEQFEPDTQKGSSPHGFPGRDFENIHESAQEAYEYYNRQMECGYKFFPPNDARQRAALARAITHPHHLKPGNCL